MSTTHTIHEDISSHGLAPGCPRCAEHAENPVRDLDLENLRALVNLAVNRDIRARSETEAIAAAKVLTAMEQFGRIAEAYPEEALSYLQKWGITIIGFEISR